jgi:phage/plasmid-like protein (TIGR03299 family)
MSHELRSTDSMMFVGETPWHGLGNALPADTNLTSKEAMLHAGLDWEVFQRPAFFKDGDNDVAICSEEGQMNVNCRTYDGATQQLGIVGPRYEIIQNHKAFDWFDPFVQNEEVSYHTAGSLKDGRIVWVLAELNRKAMEITVGDEVRKFLLLTHSHDGSRAVQVGFTPIRVVCWNTLSMATDHTANKEDKKNSSQMLRLKHTKKVLANLDAVRETINAVDARFEATAEQFRNLARRSINRADLEKYVLTVLSVASPTAKIDDPSTRMTNLAASVIISADTMKGGFDGTYWGAYNLVTDYLTWTRGREKTDSRKANDQRMSDLWLGGMGSKINDAALQTALQMAI